MSDFETAIRIMKHLFGRDYQFTSTYTSLSIQAVWGKDTAF